MTAGPDLAHQRQMGREMLAALEVPQDDMAVSRDETGPRRIVGDPELHVGAVGRVADVERIEQEDAGIVAGLERGGEPVETEPAHGVQVGGFETERGPFVERPLGRADLDPVIVIGRAVRLGPAAARIDLPVGNRE